MIKVELKNTRYQLQISMIHLCPRLIHDKLENIFLLVPFKMNKGHRMFVILVFLSTPFLSITMACNIKIF
jgi:hypothetical protein